MKYKVVLAVIAVLALSTLRSTTASAHATPCNDGEPGPLPGNADEIWVEIGPQYAFAGVDSGSNPVGGTLIICGASDLLGSDVRIALDRGDLPRLQGLGVFMGDGDGSSGGVSITGVHPLVDGDHLNVLLTSLLDTPVCVGICPAE